MNQAGIVQERGKKSFQTEVIYCPMCTHTVRGEVFVAPNGRGRRFLVRPGQQCPHCHSPLDAGYVFPKNSAA